MQSQSVYATLRRSVRHNAYSTVTIFSREEHRPVEKTSPPLSGLCTKKGELLLALQFVAGSFNGNKIVAWKMTVAVDGLPKSWPKLLNI